MLNGGSFNEGMNEEFEIDQDFEKMKIIDKVLEAHKEKALEALKNAKSVENFEPSISDNVQSETLARIQDIEPDFADPSTQSIALLKLSYINALSCIIMGNVELGVEELRQTRDSAEDLQRERNDQFADLWYEINDLIKEILRLQKSLGN